MPYVKPIDRHRLDPLISQLQGEIATEGELNYVFTRLAAHWAGGSIHKTSYAKCNSVVGVFASALAEFQRRFVARYEDMKRSENGDVHEYVIRPS